jgi:histidine triad (HIT) family protein
LPKEVEVYGHTLVVPKKHYADLYDIPYEILADISRISKMLTIKYKEKINATGMNLMHASGIDGEQSVYHFHIHLLPRFENDGLHTRPKLPDIDVDKDELLKKIKIIY